MKQVNEISILQGTFGCPSGRHAGVDPYWDQPNWSEAARGDAGSYGGDLDSVRREPGESWEAFWRRAQERANELDRELRCPRCYGG
jgi:hypothetical protein